MLSVILASNIDEFVLFTYPIGWDELGVIATAVAVFVALWANRGARKQLKSALKMQEQSKNVALLDQRVGIADSIREDKEPSITAMRVLFSDDICSYYDALCQARKRYQDAQSDETTFFKAAEESTAKDGQVNHVKSQIEEYEFYMSRPDCPDKIFADYREYCNKNEMWWSDTGLSDDRRTYNHAEIRERMVSASADIKDTKKKLLDAIEKDIAASIAPVDKKK